MQEQVIDPITLIDRSPQIKLDHLDIVAGIDFAHHQGVIQIGGCLQITTGILEQLADADARLVAIGPFPYHGALDGNRLGVFGGGRLGFDLVAIANGEVAIRAAGQIQIEHLGAVLAATGDHHFPQSIGLEATSHL